MVCLLNSIRAIVLLDDVRMLFEWCNLLLIVCCGALYYITFYKILVLDARISFVNAFLDVLSRLRANALRSLSKELGNANTR